MSVFFKEILFDLMDGGILSTIIVVVSLRKFAAAPVSLYLRECLKVLTVGLIV
jgi:hypothetical protein